MDGSGLGFRYITGFLDLDHGLEPEYPPVGCDDIPWVDLVVQLTHVLVYSVDQQDDIRKPCAAFAGPRYSRFSATYAAFVGIGSPRSIRGSPRSNRGIFLTPTSREYKKGCPGLRLFACECNFRTYGLSGVVVRYDEHMADVHMGLG